MYPIRTSRTINQWAGWSEAVSHNNGTTQLQPHVEDRKVEHGSWSNDPNDPNVPLLLGTKELVSAVEQRQPATCWVSAGRSQEPHLSGIRHHTTATSPTRQDTSAIVLYLDIFKLPQHGQQIIMIVVVVCEKSRVQRVSVWFNVLDVVK